MARRTPVNIKPSSESRQVHGLIDDLRGLQGTALGKCLRAWSCTYRSMPAGVGQHSSGAV